MKSWLPPSGLLLAALTLALGVLLTPGDNVEMQFWWFSRMQTGVFTYLLWHVTVLLLGCQVQVALHELGHVLGAFLAGLPIEEVTIGATRVTRDGKGYRLSLNRDWSFFLGGRVLVTLQGADRAARLSFAAMGLVVTTCILLFCLAYRWTALGHTLTAMLTRTAVFDNQLLAWGLLLRYVVPAATSRGSAPSDRTLIARALRPAPPPPAVSPEVTAAIADGRRLRAQQVPFEQLRSSLRVQVPVAKSDGRLLVRTIARGFDSDQPEEARELLEWALTGASVLSDEHRQALLTQGVAFFALVAKDSARARRLSGELMIASASEPGAALLAQAVLEAAQGRKAVAGEHLFAWRTAKSSLAGDSRSLDVEWIETAVEALLRG